MIDSSLQLARRTNVYPEKFPPIAQRRILGACGYIVFFGYIGVNPLCWAYFIVITALIGIKIALVIVAMMVLDCRIFLSVASCCTTTDCIGDG